MVVDTGCERGGDGVLPVRVVTSAFPSIDIDNLTCDEGFLSVSADPMTPLAFLTCPVKDRLDVSADGGSFLASS